MLHVFIIKILEKNDDQKSEITASSDFVLKIKRLRNKTFYAICNKYKNNIYNYNLKILMQISTRREKVFIRLHSKTSYFAIKQSLYNGYCALFECLRNIVPSAAKIFRCNCEDTCFSTNTGSLHCKYYTATNVVVSNAFACRLLENCTRWKRSKCETTNSVLNKKKRKNTLKNKNIYFDSII